MGLQFDKPFAESVDILYLKTKQRIAIDQNPIPVPETDVKIPPRNPVATSTRTCQGQKFGIESKTVRFGVLKKARLFY